LFERVIRDHADDRLQAAMARSDLARWYEQEGDDAHAAEEYRGCLAAEQEFGSLQTGAELALAELLVRALALVRLAARAGDREAARSAARSALEVLGDDRADFARHPDVGLIRADAATVEESKTLARRAGKR
jgi:hypothetical protein